MGETETEWNPWAYLQERHPDVYVFVQHLRGGVRGCADVPRRAIWLDIDQSETEMRCALTFEIAVLEQGPAPRDPRARQQQERQAIEWATRKLISIEAMTLACAGATDPEHVADRLGVCIGTLRHRWRCLTDAEQDAVFAVLCSPQVVL